MEARWARMLLVSSEDKSNDEDIPRHTGVGWGKGIVDNVENAANMSAEAARYLAEVRRLVEGEQIAEARKLLHAAPPHLSDEPSLRRWRSLLAPPRVTAAQRRDTDRRREYAWLRTHSLEYRGQWVALDDGCLVAAAPSLRELRERLKHCAARFPLVHHLA